MVLYTQYTKFIVETSSYRFTRFKTRKVNFHLNVHLERNLSPTQGFFKTQSYNIHVNRSFTQSLTVKLIMGSE